MLRSLIIMVCGFFYQAQYSFCQNDSAKQKKNILSVGISTGTFKKDGAYPYAVYPWIGSGYGKDLIYKNSIIEKGPGLYPFRPILEYRYNTLMMMYKLGIEGM